MWHVIAEDGIRWSNRKNEICNLESYGWQGFSCGQYNDSRGKLETFKYYCVHVEWEWDTVFWDSGSVKRVKEWRKLQKELRDYWRKGKAWKLINGIRI